MTDTAVASDQLVRRRGLTRAQYDALVDTGLLDGEPVELLGGALVEMSAPGDAHARAITRLTRWLVPRLPDPWVLRVQLPLAVTDDSEPEPDLAVVVEPSTGHPTTAVLTVEITDSSRRTDLLHKPGLYAAAAVDQYWVVDLRRREVVVHGEPGAGTGYATVRRQPWSTPLEVLGVQVHLAVLLKSSTVQVGPPGS